MERVFDIVLAVSLSSSFSFAGPPGGSGAIRTRPPIFFRQQRPGLNGLPFKIYKFRTMVDLRDTKGHLLPDVKRLTPFGNFLRKNSLGHCRIVDVLRGEMEPGETPAFIVQVLDRYTREQARVMK